MDEHADRMQPLNPSDPRATVIHSTGDIATLPEIPGYRVVRKLGQGGMATVYEAVQITLDRPVSIKVMEHGALADETGMQRFENEARTIARLSHPNIVAIHEIGRTGDGRLFFSMPYLPNGDLAQHDLQHDDVRILELLRTLLSALDYAHARGIVHRDVKQENVLFDAGNRPLLADFGIAMSRHDDVRITTAGFAVGSAAYMAPEQARGDAVDGRADLYSVGVLTFELLTGQLPFHSTDAFALALMHAQKEIPRLPPGKKHWQAFIDRAMAKEPAQRFASAGQMVAALDAIGHRGRSISNRASRMAAPAAAGRWRPAMLALVALGVLGGGVYALRDRLASVPPATAPATTTITASAERNPAMPPPIASSVPAHVSAAPPSAPALATPEQPTPGPVPPAAVAAAPTAPKVGIGAAASGAVASLPGFVKLHERIGNYPPAAISTTAVTRRQYAAFVAATHRPPSACFRPEPVSAPAAEAQRPERGGFERGRHRFRERFAERRAGRVEAVANDAGGPNAWNDPGFPQQADDPVVCVNWFDATAYAQWLGAQRGQHLRLPSAAEWSMALAGGISVAGAGAGTVSVRAGSPNALGLYGLDGNIGQWLVDCGAMGCSRHRVGGRSWHHRGNDAMPSGRPGERGFDDVGFRLVQVLGPGVESVRSGER